MASDLPVDLLEEILLRLDDAADLARASAACGSFRRVVSNSRFLRRFRSLHRRPVIGLLLDDPSYGEKEFLPAQSPRRSALAAADFAKAADFTFSFLPDRSHWRVCDVRDGRVLLARCPIRHYMFADLVAYDPLHQRHVQIPTIPGDQLLAAAMQDGNNEALTLDDPFFAPPVADENERDDDEGLGFRVMCTGLTKTMVAAFLFSSARGQWRFCASFNNQSYMWMNLPAMWSREYVHNCFCWAHDAANSMLVFDTREMKFSITDLPHESIGKFKMAVKAGDGRLGLLLLSSRSRSTTMDLYSKAWQGIQEPGEEWQWQHDSSVPMHGFNLILVGAAEGGYVLLRGIRAKQLKLWPRTAEKKPEAHYFTLDLKTLLVEKLCVLE